MAILFLDEFLKNTYFFLLPTDTLSLLCFSYERVVLWGTSSEMDTLKSSPLIDLTIITALLSIGLLCMHVPIVHPAWMYTFVFIGASLLFCWLCRAVERVTVPRGWLFVAVGVALLIRLSFVTTTPVGSDDIYRYMWDGKVQSAQINPYLFSPDSSALKPLQSHLLPSAVNHRDLKTLYFPFSEWAFYVCYQLSGEAVWGYKLLLLAAEGATLVGLYLLLSLFRIPEKFVLLYAFCPLPILQFALDGHLDALGFPFLLFGLLLYSKERKIPGLLLIGLSMSIKPVALVLLPILFLLERSWNRRLLTIVVPSATVMVQFLPYMATSNPFEALATFARNWTFNGVVFEGLYHFLADNQKSRIICLVMLSIALLMIYLTRKDFLKKVHSSVLLLLLFSPVVHPWYIAWLAVLMPLTRQWSAIIYSATASLTSLTILSYRLHGVWDQAPWILVVEYLPVILLFLWELRKTDMDYTLPVPVTEAAH